MKKILMFLIMGIFLLSFASSLDCWATPQQNTEVNLLQKCPTCTYVNITSITYPNGTIFLNEEMQNEGVNYNYTLPDSSQLGIITYGTIGDKNGANPPQYEDLCIEITSTGRSLDVSESLIYFILAFGVLLLFLLSFYFMISTPYGNDVDEKGAVIKITKLKYVKLGLILLSWVLFTWFLNILIGLSDSFVSLTMYYGFFGFIFETMNAIALPLGVVVIVIALFEIVRDINIQKAISKFGSSH